MCLLRAMDKTFPSEGYEKHHFSKITKRRIDKPTHCPRIQDFILGFENIIEHGIQICYGATAQLLEQ